MSKIRASAVRWHSSDHPGWVELHVIDVHGRLHRVVEKVPVVTSMDLAADSNFPIELWLDVETHRRDGDAVVVVFAHGVETSDGARRLSVSAADVV